MKSRRVCDNERMVRYWQGAHTKHRNMYHIVWIPKYRKKVLSGRIKGRVEEEIRDIANFNNWEIQEINIQVDHVHLMIQIPPSMSVSEAVKFLKGRTSNIVRKELPEIKKVLWGNNFWAEGYFCATVGEVSELEVRRYIQNQ